MFVVVGLLGGLEMNLSKRAITVWLIVQCIYPPTPSEYELVVTLKLRLVDVMSSLVKHTAFAHLYVLSTILEISFSLWVCCFQCLHTTDFRYTTTSLPPVRFACFGDFGIIT